MVSEKVSSVQMNAPSSVGQCAIRVISPDESLKRRRLMFTVTSGMLIAIGSPPVFELGDSIFVVSSVYSRTCSSRYCVFVLFTHQCDYPVA